MTGPSRIVASIVAVVLLGGAVAPLQSCGGRRSRRSSRRGRAFDAALVKRAATWRRSAIATTAIRCAAARILPAACRCRRRSARSSPPTSRRMPRPGIGRWSEAAFRRAMRSGVNREGQHLYPTFPYDHFTNVSDEDDRALYAFLMTRQPVRAPARENQLSFPLDQRRHCGMEIAVSSPRHLSPDPQSAEWNRGAYLVEGLAHCGACHTPRNALGAERASAQFAGGDVDNWHAYAINDQSPAPVPWDADALFAYLREAGIPTTAPRAGRWRRWSAICLRCRKRRPRDRGLYGRRVRRADAGSQTPGRGGAGAGQVPVKAPVRFPSQRGRCIDLRRGLRDMPRERHGHCPMAGSISRSAPRSPAPIRATSPTSCCRASRPWKASAARSCPALPPA